MHESGITHVVYSLELRLKLLVDSLHIFFLRARKQELVNPSLSHSTAAATHGVNDAQRSQSGTKFGNRQRVGGILVKVAERRLELFQLSWRQVGVLP